jgi:hypothetical protein
MKRMLRFGLSVACGITAVSVLMVMISDERERERLDGRTDRRIIADIYNSGTGEQAAYVYAIEKWHRFPDGKIGEGWLVRPLTVGPEASHERMWTVPPTKARVVFRK